MVDESLIGKTWGPVAHTVTREGVDAYLDATGDDNPAYHGTALAPPLYAAVYARDAVRDALTDEALDLNLFKLVHGEQDLAFPGPVRVGQTVRTSARLAQWTTRGGNEVVVLETESRVHDDVVCLGRWTLLILGGGDQ